MKFYIETYGCTANLGNSKEAEAALLKMGHLSATWADADIIIVNTCAVTEKTERKIKRRLRQIQGDRLVIAGCIAVALPGALEDIKCLTRVGILGKSAAREIADLFSKAQSSDLRRQVTSCSSLQDLCGIVNIAEGCRGGCSYCIVRNARGRLISRSPDEVVESVQKLLLQGAIEIQLAAQDTAAYGLDIGTTLPELLQRITEIPGRFMVRVGMMNPDTAMPIAKELADAFHNPKVYRFLHMPVQSGSDKILKSMGRRYSAEDFLRIIDDLRKSVDDISIITDVIAGFPGETEADFGQTTYLLSVMQPDKVNITRYSSRPGTPASLMYDMPDRIKKDRSRELTILWLEAAGRRNRRYEGEVLEALVTERGSGATMKARSANYAGIVVSGAAHLGSLCKIDIVGSNPFYLKGLLIQEIR